MRYATHNLYEGNKEPVRNLNRMVRATRRPHVIGCQEVGYLDGDVKGYRKVRAAGFEGHREYLSILGLVRNDVEVIKVQAKEVPGGAWSWKGNHRPGRLWLRIVVRYQGEVSEVWIGHRVPLGPGGGGVALNHHAWWSEDVFLRHWALRVQDRHPGRLIVMPADWNTSVGKWPSHPRSIENLARSLRARMVLRGVDGFLVLNAKGRKSTAHKLRRRFGSDGHRPVVMRLQEGRA